MPVVYCAWLHIPAILINDGAGLIESIVLVIWLCLNVRPLTRFCTGATPCTVCGMNSCPSLVYSCGNALCGLYSKASIGNCVCRLCCDRLGLCDHHVRLTGWGSSWAAGGTADLWLWSNEPLSAIRCTPVSQAVGQYLCKLSACQSTSQHSNCKPQ